MKINPMMFREYDIRGRIDNPDELTDAAVEAIGKAFAVFLARRGITEAIVAHDARDYSRRVKDLTLKALQESGVHVIEIGQVPVPIFYFSQYLLKKKGGVMITASHNPWGWSGFKHAYDYSTTLVPENVAELQDIIAQEKYISGSGTAETYPDIVTAYTEDVLSRVKIARPLRVLVDTGNGTVGLTTPDILRRAGCEVIEQYTEVSAERHHEANPSTLGMLDAMREGVQKHGADIGLGFDDDGDRLGAVDERGEPIWPDRMLAILSRDALAGKPGGSVVFDVKCSDALADEIRRLNGIPVMWKTGHSYIKAKAKETNAVLAGERSGHMYLRYAAPYEYDDATFAALKFLEYMSRMHTSVSRIIAELPRYVTSPVWHASCADEKKYGVVDRLVAAFKQEYGADKINDINGARVSFDDGWGLVRASSNVPALVLVFEGRDDQSLKRIEAIFRKKLSVCPEIHGEWKSG
ncbi:MAG: hypothetical protein A3J10_00535 [Candidatus Sungbacteria bacterium RIFCSPLOWO2_02_FULL_54_10]|uniref:Phosphomannomutase n=2 Tax=Candidatus Sungiibacteriota TaxID=1817917 RepID=A0A1G2L659_9BACT|nr:MAG: hypothetical protein A2679_00435 [Candidatus Sungbacteria bacterium RIFCSPHIGHO2_01_FULL_54_26]OHA03016.1 MAG: hypothetical protein A3C92_01385 [Candidatus Sungbacteria bacterium RIFCSPHIGHO2_02_FULL_53_17]OHA07050.1 MAG: hypothetical protein A3B34_04080 [Candidatus Sungbacteria bacterium RIFCSPLOWO2_01_FULL_54_21]OHA13348.1 MAG: hypothetical protein A3J10_00535 [Candidatus Sungbacteria bacterium RIFCSPLOWO2_02_FULL_54_10]